MSNAPGWLKEEAKRARKRLAAIPPWARPTYYGNLNDDQAEQDLLTDMAKAIYDELSTLIAVPFGYEHESKHLQGLFLDAAKAAREEMWSK